MLRSKRGDSSASKAADKRRSDTRATGLAPLGRGADSLPWWYELVHAATTSPVLGHDRAVFTNRTLRFDRIKAVGFDFDHTLAVYNCEKLDSLAMRLVIDRLIAEEGLAASFFDVIPEANFARKGLLVDTELGHVIKVDRHGHVSIAYHGIHELTRNERHAHYGDMDVIPHVTHGDRFVQVDTAFAKPEVLIYLAVAPRVDEMNRRTLWGKIRHHTDSVHRDGSLKNVITATPLEYLIPDPDTVELLRQLRAGGKRVFLLTNSELSYTSAMVNPCFGLDPARATEWLELFDQVVVEARKPRYFNRTDAPEVVGPAHLVRGGSFSDLEERLGCQGPEILYVGDHIYADLISSKRHQHWRTMLVISELEEELQVQSMLPGIVEQLKQTDERRNETERLVQHWKRIEAALARIPNGQHDALLEQVRGESTRSHDRALMALAKFIRQRESLRGKLSRATNTHWGSLFRVGSELTYYGRQLEDFACTYTSRATNLCAYPPDHYFRSSMDYLPHELESM
ncbi:MAG: HAD-IG family 5'-nucleotidase [Planctomycetota bacterium]